MSGRANHGDEKFRRIRIRRRGAWVALAAVVVTLIVADRNGLALVRQHDDLATYHGVRTTVVRVIDGDTIEVDVPDALHRKSATRVGLWGVNCPEPARAARAAEPLADEATTFTKSSTHQVQMTLWLESHQTRDGFGRVLAHVELPDRIKLNEALLEAGLAKVDERWPHSMLTRYSQLQFNAQRRGVGMWSKPAK